MDRKVTKMDLFSIEVLKRTVELAIKAMPPEVNPSVGACATAIRDFIDSPISTNLKGLQAAVTELLNLARSNGQFFIAARGMLMTRRAISLAIQNSIGPG